MIDARAQGLNLPEWWRFLLDGLTSERVVILLIAVPAFVAVNVLVGWTFNIPILMQVQPSFVPMQFNTALGFLIACYSIFSLSRYQTLNAQISAFLLIAFSGITLMQYVLNVNLGIDEIFMEAYVTTHTTFPGRMAISSTMNFLLIGSAVLLNLAWSSHQWGQLASLCFSALVLGFGLVALIGYGTGLAAAYGWGFTEMAVHTAFCFVLLGSAINLHTITERVSSTMRELFQRIALLVFGVFMFTITYTVLRADETSRLQDGIESIAQSTHREFLTQETFRNRILNELGIELLSIEKDEWQVKANAVVSARPNLVAVSAALDGLNPVEAHSIDSVIAESLLGLWRETESESAIEYRGHWYYKHTLNIPRFDDSSRLDLVILYDIDRMLERTRTRWMGGNFNIHAQLNGDSLGDSDFAIESASEINVQILGNKWKFLISPTESFISSTQNQAYSLLLIMTALFLAALVLLQHLYFRTLHNGEHFHRLNSRLSESLDAMLDAVVICNDQGVITEINEATLTLFGYTGEDLLGRNMNMLFQDNDRGKHEDYIENFQPSGAAVELGPEWDLKIATRAGDILPVSVRITKSRDNLGETIFIGVIHDLSRIAQAESHRALSDATLSAAMENSQSGWAVIDTAGTIRKVNQALLDWLGYKSQDLLNQSIHKIYPPDDFETESKVLRGLREGSINAFTEERAYFSRSGEIKWGLASKSIVKPSQQDPIIVYQIIDITSQKLLQSELENHIKALEKSNGELDQFAYVASHDLKSPLNAIAKLSSWINEDCAELLPEKSRQYLELLQGRVGRLTHLLDDLLIYSRVGRREHEFDYINVKKMSEDLLDLNAPEKPFILTAEDRNIFVPVTPFELVLRNLISNTIKHHDKEEGIIEVSADVTESGYEVRISDNGPGIPGEFRSKAVQMFQTLQSRDEVEGSGMGLAICKKTVEYYGGSLFIEDSALGGTTITMTWPIGQGKSLRTRKHEFGSHSLPH